MRVSAPRICESVSPFLEARGSILAILGTAGRISEFGLVLDSGITGVEFRSFEGSISSLVNCESVSGIASSRAPVSGFANPVSSLLGLSSRSSVLDIEITSPRSSVIRGLRPSTEFEVIDIRLENPRTRVSRVTSAKSSIPSLASPEAQSPTILRYFESRCRVRTSYSYYPCRIPRFEFHRCE